MLWELLRYPSEDARAQIYWRRRVSVLAVVVAVLLLMLFLVLRGGGSSPVQNTAAEVPGAAPVAAPPPVPAASASPFASASPAGPSSTPSPTPSAEPSATASSDPATTCPAGSMALRVAGDNAKYAAGQQPVFTLSVVDIGNSPCSVDLGTRYTTISVLSQGKPVWTSNACVTKTRKTVALTPSTEQQLQLRWDLSRNASGCSATAPPAAQGDYEVVARVGQQATYGGNFSLG